MKLLKNLDGSWDWIIIRCLLIGIGGPVLLFVLMVIDGSST